jgi:hypothetical protein
VFRNSRELFNNVRQIKQIHDTVDWNALLSDLENVDEMCNTFTETLLRVARECIPTKMVTVRNSDRPWFNSELRREIRKRDRIRKTAKKYNKLPPLVLHLELYFGEGVYYYILY